MSRLRIESVYVGRRTEPTHSKEDEPWEHFRWDVRLIRMREHAQDNEYVLDVGVYRCGIAHVDEETTRRLRGLRPRTLAYVEVMARAKPKAPSTFDVLYSVVCDAHCYESARDFEDFCADLGYDTDSRRAEGVYKACGEMARSLRRFLGADFDKVLAMDEDELRAWEANETAVQS